MRETVQIIYQQAIDDLNLIINTSSPTNIQVVCAIKRMAEIEKRNYNFIIYNPFSSRGRRGQ